MSLTLARDVDCVVDLPELLNNEVDQAEFDYVIVPLVHPLHRRDPLTSLPPGEWPLTRSDLLLNSHTWQQRVVAKISPWIDFDSPHAAERLTARKIFKEELAWVSHLGLSAIILPPPDWNCVNYASTLLASMQGGAAARFWVEVPMVSPRRSMQLQQLQGEALEAQRALPVPTREEPWECWNRLRTHAQHHPNLRVVLELGPTLPSPSSIARWCAEPLAAVIISPDTWLTNQSGFPVLSRAHQAVVKQLLGHGVHVVVRGSLPHPSGSVVYQQYLRHLSSQVPQLTEGQLFEKPYWDYLQPLMDNLESQTYETFEKDSMKYQLYELAIEIALRDDPYLKDLPEVVLMVLGAGRGPLVNAAMRAAEKLNRKLRLFALEKNPNAVNTLRNHRESDARWRDVTIINTDIRHWKPSHLADIVVSELLGSFGDNELSPECLHSSQHLLSPQAISIPSSYTSYLQPIATTKLWADAAAYRTEKNLETAYVVKFHSANFLDKPLPCFTFEHPDSSVPLINDRHTSLTFHLDSSALVHGLAGYFEAVLYGSVNLSIHPDTYTPDMYSWFPLFFPLSQPIYVPADSELSVDMWRLSNSKMVWYEWAVSEPVVTNIQNVNGRSWWIGL